MKKEFSNLPLRKGVGIVLLNKENKIFVAKRIDNPKNFWQMPQGGVDRNKIDKIIKDAEKESGDNNIDDQKKYLIDEKIEALKNLSLN